MLRHIHDLSDDHEYFFVWMGQSTSRPFGTREEAYELFPGLEPKSIGDDIQVTLPGSYAGGGATESLTSVTDLEPGEPGLQSKWTGAQIRLGTPASPLAGYGIVRRNEQYVLYVEWQVVPTVTSSTVDAYLVFDDHRNSKFEHVRVLTPYQPTTDDVNDREVLYPEVPATGWANGAEPMKTPLAPTPTATTFENHALLLPFTWHEGVNGYGISERTATIGTVTFSATGASWGGALTILANVLAGGFVVVNWTDGTDVPMRSWARIASNTTGAFTIEGTWGGDGDPTGMTVPAVWEAWIPHWLDSPHAYDAYKGFTYPSNDMHPCSDHAHTAIVDGAVIRNRPRGHVNKNYRDLFGDIFLFATRMSQAIGKRVNIIHLGINGSSFYPSVNRNPRGFPGKIGWYDQNEHLSWAPGDSRRIWGRVETLLRECLPNALAAEGNTKTAKVLGFYLSQGEGDALSQHGRFYYAESLGQFKREFRNLVDDLGLNPYSGTEAEVPFVQPTIMTMPYGLKGTYNYYGIPLTFNADVQGFINDAIKRQAEEDEFSDWYSCDDLPRNILGADGPDVGHCNGVGECVKALRNSRLMTKVVDRALSYGSSALVATSRSKDRLKLCNQALALIGQKAITSFTDGSNNATVCDRLFDQARDTILQARQWGFAMTRKSLTEVRFPKQSLYAQYGHCYVVPAEAVRPFQVLPPDRIREDFELGLVTQFELTGPVVTGNPYSDQFVADWTDKTGDNLDAIGDEVDPSELPTVDRLSLKPVPFQLERAPTGGLLLYTDQDQAVLRYVDRLADSLEFPTSFRQCVIHHLAAMLATALIRGPAGEKVAAQNLIKAQSYLNMASEADGVAHAADVHPFDAIPGHIAHR